MINLPHIMLEVANVLHQKFRAKGCFGCKFLSLIFENVRMICTHCTNHRHWPGHFEGFDEDKSSLKDMASKKSLRYKPVAKPSSPVLLLVTLRSFFSQK